jgi:uncharacterized protein YecE (DUF72 family)
VSQNFYLGTSGFKYKDWREIFYPSGLAQQQWLAFYAQHYNTVEINATFYRYFPRSVFVRWRDETNADFRFTLKDPKVITHEKRLHQIDGELNQFFESIQDLSAKLCTVLWQFPASFKWASDETVALLIQFLKQLPSTTKHVVEFRDRSWFKEDVYALLNTHHIGLSSMIQAVFRRQK